jgi:hypothetical protein
VLSTSSVYENMAHRARLASTGGGGGEASGRGADIYNFSTIARSRAADAASDGGAGEAVGYEQAVSTQPAFYDSLNAEAEAYC